MNLTKTKVVLGAAAVFIVVSAAVYLGISKLLDSHAPGGDAAVHETAGLETPQGKASIPVTPIDMTNVYTTPASVFDQITTFPAWKTVPRGENVFGNVKFQIGGMICLWGAGNAAAGLKFPESRLGIPINQKFETLYVFHGCFYSSASGTPVYEIVFRYTDNTSATNVIRYGDDVLDWYASRGGTVDGPTDRRSKLAWHGDNSADAAVQPVRFCMTAVENPQPSLEVGSIDLYSSKERSAACVLAFSTSMVKTPQSGSN